jgi:phosphoglycolate phosphatase
MKKGIIFDLDGTLLNSLVDIADAVNFVLKENDFEEYPFEDYKQFIGNGIEVLARKALPQDITEEAFQKLFTEIRASYQQRQNTRTAPYSGILSLLTKLNSLNIKIAILSNKPHEFVGPTVNRYFKDIKFEIKLGSRKGVERKPNPEAVFEILDIMNLRQEECFFVGDTSTDIKTGKNSGIETVGVTWGFRDVEELKESGANHIINHPSELLFNL